MPETLTLSNGTVLENSNAIEDDESSSLFVYTRNGYTIKDIFDLLYNPENTQKISYRQVNGDTVVFRGYTRLKAVRDEGRGVITAVLKK
jgi:hypothetical protein